MTKFRKISEEQFIADGMDRFATRDEIKLPLRATKHSAGYDFFTPIDITLYPGETIKIPTGVRVLLEPNQFLAIVPRSGLGFKYRLQLDNTIGIIDADYSGSDNEGHIWIKMTNDTYEDKTLCVAKGEAIAQGIIMNYCITDDDNVTKKRNGGFGSTSK